MDFEIFCLDEVMSHPFRATFFVVCRVRVCVNCPMLDFVYSANGNTDCGENPVE